MLHVTLSFHSHSPLSTIFTALNFTQTFFLMNGEHGWCHTVPSTTVLYCSTHSRSWKFTTCKSDDVLRCYHTVTASCMLWQSQHHIALSNNNEVMMAFTTDDDMACHFCILVLECGGESHLAVYGCRKHTTWQGTTQLEPSIKIGTSRGLELNVQTLYHFNFLQCFLEFCWESPIQPLRIFQHVEKHWLSCWAFHLSISKARYYEISPFRQISLSTMIHDPDIHERQLHLVVR